MNKRTVCAVLCAACGVVCSQAAVTCAVDDCVMTTYMYGDPDPVPRTSATSYPYHRYDSYSNAGKPRKWRRVTMDNGKIRVEFRPEIGGRVWGAKDLSSGNDFIYHNHVVKFRDLSVTGPYVSSGIEFNFGVMGHAAYVTQPVDWCVRTNADGSASYFCGGFERITRQFWQVEVKLEENKRAFATRATWYNASGLPGPCYHWMNAAFAGGGATRYLHPAANWIGHGGEVHPWPVEDGHAIDVYDQNDLAGACGDNRWDHVPGRIEDHRAEHLVNGDTRIFGIWWPHRGIGAYHYNPADEKLGRKIWMWALSRQGEFWHGLLTDDDGPYIELQSGRVFQQPGYDYRYSPFKFAAFAPGRTDVMNEEWGVISSPEEYERRFAPRRGPVDRPLACPHDMNWEGAWGRYQLAVQLLNSRTDDAGAEKGLLESLELEPCLSPALDALAVLYVRQGRYEEARAMAREALGVDTYDPAANYCEGLVLAARGDKTATIERFATASADRNWRSAALVESARLHFRDGDFPEALSLSRKAQDSNAHDLYAILAEAVALRKLGRSAQAAKVLGSAVARTPLFHAFAFELAKGGSGEDWRRNMHGACKDDDLLEMALWYDGSGLAEEALEILASSDSVLARLQEAQSFARLGREEDSAKILTAAAALDQDFVFPARRELLPALENAVKKNASWRFKYLLAVFRAANGKADEAKRLLAACGDEPDDSVFYVFRATQSGRDAARRDLRRAAGLGDSWRVGMELYLSYAAEGDWKRAAEVTEEYLAKFPGNDFLEMKRARALLKSGEPAKVVEFLESIDVLPSELGEKPSSIYIEANVELARRALERGDSASARQALAKATAFPEKLGAGRPYRLDRMIERWPKSVREFWRSENPPFIEDGDRVLFFGDSIVQWSGFVPFVRHHWKTRYPASRTVFLNGGRGGEKSSGGVKRVAFEVDLQKPTKAIVAFGMNDTFDKDDAMPERYRASLKAIVAEFRKRGIPVMLMTPTPYDEYTSFVKAAPDAGRNERLLTGLAEIVREVAAAEKVPLIELHRPLTALLKAHPETQYVRDRMHPTNAVGASHGTEALSAVLLRALGEIPVKMRMTKALWAETCNEGVARRDLFKKRAR